MEAVRPLTLTVPYNVVVLVEPEADAPTLMLVVEPDAPAVPRLRVLVAPLSVTPPPTPIVMALVDGASVTVPV